MPQMKRKKQQSQLPTDLISSLEKTDKQASTKRRKQFTTHTLPKSLATKAQYQIQTNLIECRILLQRALTYFNEDGNNDHDESSHDGVGVSKNIDMLLAQLVDARNTLCHHTISKNDETKSDHSSDDESSNDEDYGQNSNDAKHHQQTYDKLKSYWKTVLNRHHDNINITKHSTKDSNSKFFQVIDQSFWSQIENTVEHNMLLEQHTHASKRNGSQNDDDDDDDDEEEEDSKDSLIQFDDTKIYQNMLQEYITLSAEQTSNNATSLAEHRLKLASSAHKNKKKDDVDRRASKGRKIRYVIHEKLKNFTFPLQREVNSLVSHVVMDEDVLFKSMLGGVLNKNK